MAAWHTRLSFASSRSSEGRNELNPVIYFSRGNHIRNQERADISKRFARERFTEQLYFRPALPFSSIVLADVPSGPLSPRLYNFLVWASLFPRVSRKVTSSRRKNRSSVVSQTVFRLAAYILDRIFFYRAFFRAGRNDNEMLRVVCGFLYKYVFCTYIYTFYLYTFYINDIPILVLFDN